MTSGGSCSFGRFNAYRGPALLQELLHLDRIECAEFVNEDNSGVELRESSYALLDFRHADQDHPCLVLVKDGPHLFETVHLQPVRLVDDDECRRVRNCFLTGLIEFKRLEVGRVDRCP
jgi:hypothetical protein